MPRKPSISYWPTRKGGGYFCIVKGDRYELALGPDDQPTVPPTARPKTASRKSWRVRRVRRKRERKRRLEPNRVTVREVL